MHFTKKTENKIILEWLKKNRKSGCIRNRLTGISDYTIVDSNQVQKILIDLQPHVKLKRKQVRLGLCIIQKMKSVKSDKDFLRVCKLVDRFGKLNYSKKRKITYLTAKKLLEK